MHEIVIFRATRYVIGEMIRRDELMGNYLVRTEDLADESEYLWWSGAETVKYPNPLDFVVEDNTPNWFQFKQSAIRFSVEFLPNIHVQHYDLSYLAGEFEYAANEVFRPFLDELATVVNTQLGDDTGECSYAFYGLFEVTADEHRNDDGGLDDLEIFAVFLGELDTDVLPVIGLTRPHPVSQYSDDGLPHYHNRD